MSANDVERLEKDLTTFRQVLATDRPADRADILPLVVLGLGALVSIPLQSMHLLWNPRFCMLTCVAPGLMLCIKRYNTVKGQRAKRPNLWQEYRVSTIAVAFLIPAALGWIWWSESLGLNRSQAGAPIIFCLGIAGLIIGVIDSQRRSYAIIGVGFAMFGACLPLLTQNQIPLAGAFVMAAATFGIAVWTFFTTRDDVQNQSGESRE